MAGILMKMVNQLKKKKIKPCRLCGGKRVGNLTICYNCFRKREKVKRELKIAKLKDRKHKRVEKDHNSYRYLHKVAWDLISRVVRLSGADENGFNHCYTCEKIFHYKDLQAGHFHHNKLDFDRRNLRPQCSRCNKWLKGNLAIYGTKLTKELGVEGMVQLLLDANTRVYSTAEIRLVIRDCQLELEAYRL